MVKANRNSMKEIGFQYREQQTIEILNFVSDQQNLSQQVIVGMTI